MTQRISRRAAALGPGVAAAAAGARPLYAEPAAFGRPTPGWSLPSDDEIRAMLVERLDVEQAGVGFVVGVIEAGRQRIVAHGLRAEGDRRPLDGDTVFEIGSNTKVFTTLLLADMALRGEVALDEPVAKLLPDSVRMPSRGGREITLRDLATHTSALPRMAANVQPKSVANPYAEYSVAQMYDFLRHYSLTRDVGERFEYSNIGVGLLGHALARRGGVDYETLVRRRITQPLGMPSTAISLTPDTRSRLARGHDRTLAPADYWDLPTIAGAGALRSTANDLMTFLAAELGLSQTPLAAAMALQVAAPRGPSGDGMEMGLGWFVRSGPPPIMWHGGGTGGFRTFMGFDPAMRRGVAVLTNALAPRGGDDIGFRILLGTPLAPPPARPPRRVAIAQAPAVLEGLVGRYQASPTIVVTVTREGEQLFARMAAQPVPVPIYAEATDRFFWRVLDIDARFERGPGGRAERMVLDQGGSIAIASRVTP